IPCYSVSCPSRRPRYDFRGRGPRHSGVASGGGDGARVRSDVQTRWLRQDLRPDERRRKTFLGSGQGGTVPSRPRLREIRKGCALSANTAFGVYVHWPFCAARCPYCDFNAHVHHGIFDEDSFVSAYVKEIEATARRAPERLVESVFFGGGTPSLMKPSSVGTILDAIARTWQVSDTAEITLEANPTSVEVDRFRGYRAAGVNRV